MSVQKLSKDQVQALLQQLNGESGNPWELRDGKLYKRYRFENFVAAFGFISRVALLAESMDHHPELYNVYNRVEISLNTHEVDGLSSRDFELARKIDQADPG